MTTFTTPFGLFRYKRAPQGFLSSGDGYNRRFGDIASHILLGWRDALTTVSCMTQIQRPTGGERLSSSSCAGKLELSLTLKKIQFSEETVDFSGFRITKDTVEPLPKYIETIKSFPTPENPTDICSWFGLINQVSHYAQLRELRAIPNLPEPQNEIFLE